MLRLRGVPLLESGHEGVDLGEAVRQPLRMHQGCRPQQVDPGVEPAEDLADEIVAAMAEHDVVQDALGAQDAVRVAAAGGLAQIRRGSPELQDGGIRGLRGEFVRRVALEDGAQCVELTRLLHRDRGHDRAAMRHRVDELLGLEPAQGLAHGGAADAEPLAQFALDQPLAGGVDARGDRLADGVLDLATERVRLDGADLVHRWVFGDRGWAARVTWRGLGWQGMPRSAPVSPGPEPPARRAGSARPVPRRACRSD